MSFFSGPFGAETLSNYVVFATSSVTPALGTIALGTTDAQLGSFIATEAFAYCPAAPGGSLVQVTFNIGFTAAAYADFVSAAVFGSNAGTAAVQLVPFKFRQLTMVATNATPPAGYASGTPRSTATNMFVNVTGLLGTPTTEKVQFFVGGFYTGMR